MTPRHVSRLIQSFPKSLSRNDRCADCAVRPCAGRRRFDEAYLVYGEENRRSMAQNLQASGALVILGYALKPVVSV